MKYEDVKPQTVYYTWNKDKYSVIPIVIICSSMDENGSFVAIDCTSDRASYAESVERKKLIVPSSCIFQTAKEAALAHIKYVEDAAVECVKTIKSKLLEEYSEMLSDTAVPAKDSGFNLDSETPSEEKKKPVIHRRRQYKYLIVDGARITFRNIANIFDTFKIDKQGYGSVSNGLTFENHKNDIVQYEASRVRDILKDNGHTVKSYAAYNFDGKLVQIKFDGE